jgi:hypothetical protein
VDATRNPRPKLTARQSAPRKKVTTGEKRWRTVGTQVVGQRRRESSAVASKCVPTLETLDRPHARGAQTFFGILDLEFDRLALAESLITVGQDAGEMHENVRTFLTTDEAEAFGRIEPLHNSLLFHLLTSFSGRYATGDYSLDLSNVNKSNFAIRGDLRR